MDYVPYSSISGKVTYDNIPLADHQVNLYKVNADGKEELVSSLYTSDNGYFQFENLVSDRYRVRPSVDLYYCSYRHNKLTVDIGNDENFSNYNLTHQLYQLDSNCRSGYHQQIILKHLNDLTVSKKSVSFDELNKIIQTKENLIISKEVLRREVELLILRNLLKCNIEGNNLVFASH